MNLVSNGRGRVKTSGMLIDRTTERECSAWNTGIMQDSLYSELCVETSPKRTAVNKVYFAYLVVNLDRLSNLKHEV